MNERINQSIKCFYKELFNFPPNPNVTNHVTDQLEVKDPYTRALAFGQDSVL